MCISCTMNPKNEIDYYWWKLRYMFKDKTTKRIAAFINNHVDLYLS